MIRKELLFVLLSIVMLSCSNNDDNNSNNNPNIPNIQFDTGGQINTTLPQYNDLQFPGNYIVLNNYGVNGISVFYTGGTRYRAFELSDPNHSSNTCSRLIVESINNASCQCDDGNSYSITGGSPNPGTTGQQGLKEYFVEVNGSVIRVSNN
jgi:hypothetical protein